MIFKGEKAKIYINMKYIFNGRRPNFINYDVSIEYKYKIFREHV